MSDEKISSIPSPEYAKDESSAQPSMDEDALDQVRSQLLAGELEGGRSPSSEIDLGLSLKMQVAGAKVVRSAWLVRGLIVILVAVLVGELLLMQAGHVANSGEARSAFDGGTGIDVSEYEIGPTPADIPTPVTVWASDEALPVEEIEEPEDASAIPEPPDPTPWPTPVD